jgi:hypothetical protein
VRATIPYISRLLHLFQLSSPSFFHVCIWINTIFIVHFPVISLCQTQISGVYIAIMLPIEVAGACVWGWCYLGISEFGSSKNGHSPCPCGESPPTELEWSVAVTPFFSPKRRPHFKTSRRLGKNKSIVTCSDGTRNQDWLCWWRPAAIYPTDHQTDRHKLPSAWG